MIKDSYTDIFSYVFKNQKRHACFLNTLAFMELCGAKKLTRLLQYRSDNFLLEHLAEEYRHAYYLRKLASRLVDHELDFSDTYLVNAQAAKKYISHLDRSVCILIKEQELHKTNHYSHAAYLLCTYVIEHRALPFYQEYQKALSNAGCTINIKSIISEEEKHLSYIAECIEQDNALKDLIEPSFNIENKLFYSWIDGLKGS